MVTQAGNYFASATNGCGTSGISNIIEVQQAEFVPVFQVGNTCYFLAPDGGTSFQWNLNGQPIAGATGSFYLATQIGFFSLTMTNSSGCNGTSASIFADCTVGTSESFPYGSVSVFPNPADQTISIDITLLKKEASITIDVYSVDGRIIKQGMSKTANIDGVQATFDSSLVPSGLYYFLIHDLVNYSNYAMKFAVIH